MEQFAYRPSIFGLLSMLFCPPSLAYNFNDDRGLSGSSVIRWQRISLRKEKPSLMTTGPISGQVRLKSNLEVRSISSSLLRECTFEFGNQFSLINRWKFNSTGHALRQSSGRESLVGNRSQVTVHSNKLGLSIEGNYLNAHRWSNWSRVSFIVVSVVNGSSALLYCSVVVTFPFKTCWKWSTTARQSRANQGSAICVSHLYSLLSFVWNTSYKRCTTVRGIIRIAELNGV